MKVYLACYDSEDDRTRDRVAQVLGEYGQRVQKSVLELRLRDGSDLERIKARLRALAEGPLDIRLYHLCAQCRAACESLAGEPVAAFPATIIV